MAGLVATGVVEASSGGELEDWQAGTEVQDAMASSVPLQRRLDVERMSESMDAAQMKECSTRPGELMRAKGVTSDRDETSDEAVALAPVVCYKSRHFANFARSRCLAENSAILGGDAQEFRPPFQQTVGQPYTVVHRKPVVIRVAASPSAQALRTAPPGARLVLFEWDPTRRWRRLDTNRAVDADLDEGERSGLVRAEGWVLIEHPKYGLLLEALLAHKDEQGHEQVNPGDDYDADAKSVELEPTAPPPPRTHPPPPETPQDESLSDALEQHKDRERQIKIALASVEVEIALTSVENHPTLDEPVLMRAARAGSYMAVGHLLRCAVHVDTPDRLGETALFEAVSGGRVDIVALLLCCNADPAIRSKQNMTASQLASDPVLESLLDRWEGKDANERLVNLALLRVDARERPRVAERLGIDRLTRRVPAALRAGLEAIDQQCGTKGLAVSAPPAAAAALAQEPPVPAVPAVPEERPAALAQAGDPEPVPTSVAAIQRGADGEGRLPTLYQVPLDCRRFGGTLLAKAGRDSDGERKRGGRPPGQLSTDEILAPQIYIITRAALRRYVRGAASNP